MDYGIQLYSVRDVSEKSLDSALKQMASLGYKSVEFAGFFGNKAEDVSAMLKNYGLTVSGTHSSFIDLINNYDDVVSYHKKIGNHNYIIPGYDLSSQEKLDEFVSLVNPLKEKLAADGITLGYHNHAHEFKLNADGSVIYEQILYRTDLMLEVDTYWAYVGMKDPIALLQRLGDRVKFIHIKDGSPEGNGTPLGMGSAPVKDVFDYARSHSLPMVVESETCSPDGPTEAKICIDYLKSIEG